VVGDFFEGHGQPADFAEVGEHLLLLHRAPAGHLGLEGALKDVTGALWKERLRM
jgi:hypothetical protein